MASLRSGVIANLLDGMEDDDATFGRDDRKPVLLQIRSIIPVLEEGDLWPNRGFYLKVSDRSHAIYVSLPHEQNDMILSNKLKLGQFIYVQKLEKADPVPLLRGLNPVPGRRLCEGSPEDINSPTTVVKFLQSLDTDSIVEEKAVISEKKIIENSADSKKLGRGLSDPDALVRNSDDLQQRKGRIRSSSASKASPGVKTIGSYSSRPTFTDDDSDSDSNSTLSSISSISKRKSWTQSEILGIKEIFDSSVIKNEIKPVARSRSATASPVRSVRSDSSDEYSSSTVSRKKKLIKGTSDVKNPVPKVILEQTSHPVSSLVHDAKGAETSIAWGSLPSLLVKLGKEVVRQRDLALTVAAEALQEASAAERLLKSLSAYSELHVSQGADFLPYVDQFIDLEDDLARTKLIMQSLTNISPFKTSETGASGTPSVKEALNIAVQRKKNATAWIKSAVVLDLSTSSSDSLKPTATPAAASNTAKKSSSRCIKPKGACIMKKKSIDDIPHMLLTSDKDNQAEWTRPGNSLNAATELVTSLQDECRKLFLESAEKYLDEFESKIFSMQSESQLAGMMYKVKRVSDWLDVLAGKESNCNIDDSAREAYERVRNKIYGILLNHVERTVVALEKC